MPGKSEKVKGHIKEAVASLTGDKELESEGKAEGRTGETKEKLAHAQDKVEEVVDKGKGKLQEVIGKGKGALRRR